MEAEELLKPRYKVIADYPDMKDWVLGEILYEDWSWHKDDVSKDSVSKYPHLFKKLEWWEDRKEDEMPEYVKVIKDNCSIPYKSVVKPIRFGSFPKAEGVTFGNEYEPYALLLIEESSNTHDAGKEIKMHCINLLPATDQEYLNQNKPQ